MVVGAVNGSASALVEAEAESVSDRANADTTPPDAMASVAIATRASWVR